jgi:hypothetical protein
MPTARRAKPAASTMGTVLLPDLPTVVGIKDIPIL